jgi:hypothetical protein
MHDGRISEKGKINWKIRCSYIEPFLFHVLFMLLQVNVLSTTNTSHYYYSLFDGSIYSLIPKNLPASKVFVWTFLTR